MVVSCCVANVVFVLVEGACNDEVGPNVGYGGAVL